MLDSETAGDNDLDMAEWVQVRSVRRVDYAAAVPQSLLLSGLMTMLYYKDKLVKSLHVPRLL